MPTITIYRPVRTATIAAAESIAARGEPVTYAALMAETGLRYSQLKGAVRHARTAGDWRWVIVPALMVRRQVRRGLSDDKAAGGSTRWLAPTQAEIRFRSYRILREVGMDPSEARGRVVAKAMRFGG